MTEEEIHNANNHLRGTEFDTNSTDENAPVRRGIITIDGAVIMFDVFPARKSRQGRIYNPVSLHYARDCKYVLKAVRVNEA